MNFDDFIKFIMQFNENLAYFPKENKSFKVHFDLVVSKIKSNIEYESAFLKCISVEAKWPTHTDIWKASLKELPDIDCRGVLYQIDEYHRNIKNLLIEKFNISLPHKGGCEMREATNMQTDAWLKQIGRKLDELKEKYYKLELDPKIIFTEKVLIELNEMKLIGESNGR